MKELLYLIGFAPLAFTALLPVINPVGSALLFLSFVEDADHATRKDLARRIAINTVIFLAVILVAGIEVLRFFGISLPVVQVSGGFVLFSMGWSLLNKPDAPADPAPPTDSASELRASAFYPLTFPLTAGPACVVVTLTLGAHATGKTLPDTVLAHLGALVGIMLIGIIVYLAYANADRTTARLSASATQGILRIVSFILMCIGAEIMWRGISTLVKSIH